MRYARSMIAAIGTTQVDIDTTSSRVMHERSACAGGSEDVPLRRDDGGERDRDGGIPQEDEAAHGSGEQLAVQADRRALLHHREDVVSMSTCVVPMAAIMERA